MKKLSVTMLVAFIMLAGAYTSRAQIGISVRIGTPPVWAPAPYAHNTRYYYIPEIDSYYDAYNHGYYYNNGPGWAFSASLPGIYAGYDIGSLHHVRVNYFGARPYEYFGARRATYFQQYHPVEFRNGRNGIYHYGGRGFDHGHPVQRGGFDHGHGGFDHGHDDHGDHRHDDHGHDHGGDRGHDGHRG